MKASTFSVRLDEKVILTMIIICIAASFVTAFRYSNDKPCVDFEFRVTSNDYKVGHYIFFNTADTKNADTWEWDFGDKTAIDKVSGPSATHIYNEAGQYDITLTINGKCKQFQSVNINNVIKDSIPFVIPQVIWPPDPIKVAQPVVFRDNTNGANRWEWYIGSGKDSKNFTSQDVPFTFEKPGTYEVNLMVNGNADARIVHMIKVEALPVTRAPINYAGNRGGDPAPQRTNRGVIPDAPSGPSQFSGNNQASATPAKPELQALTKEKFLEMIQGVVDKTFLEQDFDPYMCGNPNVRVSFNGEDISFHEAIINLQELRRLKSLKAIAFTNEGTNCIKRISIVTKKKGWLSR
jgi:PKD repeat protein